MSASKGFRARRKADKKKPPASTLESKAWDMLWKSYISALRAKKFDVAERLKKQIDSFNVSLDRPV